MWLPHEAGTINQEILQYLVAFMRAKAHITLEIEVEAPDGVVRIVMENSLTSSEEQ